MNAAEVKSFHRIPIFGTYLGVQRQDRGGSMTTDQLTINFVSRDGSIVETKILGLRTPGTTVRVFPIADTDASAITQFLTALAQQDREAFRTALRSLDHTQSWKKAFEAAAALRSPTESLRDFFHGVWTESGRQFREAIGDDPTLVSALRRLLPSYAGPDMLLYRGETADDAAQERFGFSWTSRRTVAEMFARGLKGVPGSGGGVLLEALVSAKSILAAPSDHSRYLEEDEYVVDPEKISSEVRILVQFPEHSSEDQRMY
jgi:hypothetical protein